MRDPIVIVALAVAGCTSVDPVFPCTASEQCAVDGEAGFCEPEGVCSFVDATCPSTRRRHGPYAGADSDQCVVPPDCASLPCSHLAALSSVGGHACAVKTDGSLSCWGLGTAGELGVGTVDSSPLPVTVPLADVAEVGTGEFHTCAVDAAGGVWCWGLNDRGQVGDGTTARRSDPRRVGGVERATQVVTGQLHSCALTVEGELSCWGANDQQSLGDGSGIDQHEPVGGPSLAGAAIDQLAIADGSTCALGTDSVVYCWGNADHGLLGDGQEVDRAAPAPVSLGGDAMQVAGSCHLHYCAVTRAGTVKCWGSNLSGELGDGNTATLSAPVQVAGITDAVEVAAGTSFSCARTRNDEVWCWGDNTMGQLGDGTRTASPLPVRTTDMTGGTRAILDIEAGCGHACVVLSDATVWCWGDNLAGALGDGTLDSSAAPVQVAFP